MEETHILRNGKQLTIRRLQPADAEATLEYVERVSGETDFLSFGRGEFGYTVERERLFIEDTLAANNKLMLVATVGDEFIALLGFAGGARPRIQHVGEFGLSVRQDHWGLGIGSLLIVSLVEWARTSGVVTKINLKVRTDNSPAIRLYERLGFVREGTARKDMRINGRYFDHHLMGLDLQHT